MLIDRNENGFSCTEGLTGICRILLGFMGMKGPTGVHRVLQCPTGSNRGL